MSVWIIISWVAVAVLTGINIFVFLKLKEASEQMLKVAFPGAKDMNQALSQMQQMMGSMGGAMPGVPGGGPGAKTREAQLKAAMARLQQQGGGLGKGRRS
jgi:hypothetical protein